MRQYNKELKTPFHIYNRGVDKRVIFTDYEEYCRFVFLMWACRTGSPSVNLSRQNIINAAEDILNGKEPNAGLGIKEHAPLVAFITWNIMPNHFHFMLASMADGGIAKYMAKLSNAYTKYFNARHDRTGRLFQGSYQSIEVKNTEHLFTLIGYINLNHVEIVEPSWKEGEMKDESKAATFANTYQWSAHQDYLGARKSLLVDKNSVSDLLENPFDETGGLNGYIELLDRSFLKEAKLIKDYCLEA